VAGRVAAEGDDPVAAEAMRGEDGREADGAVTDDSRGPAGPYERARSSRSWSTAARVRRETNRFRGVPPLGMHRERLGVAGWARRLRTTNGESSFWIIDASPRCWSACCRIRDRRAVTGLAVIGRWGWRLVKRCGRRIGAWWVQHGDREQVGPGDEWCS